MLTLWPAPNVPGTNFYQTTITNALDTRQEFVRADYDAGAGWFLTGRYLHDRGDSRGEFITRPELAAGHRYLAGHFAVLEARRVQGRVLSEISYQLSSNRISPEEPGHTRDEVGLQVPELFAENAANLTPNVAVFGLIELWGTQPHPREYRNHTFSSALTVQRGTHTLKAGGLIALEHVNSNLLWETTQGWFILQAGGGFTAFQNFLRGNASGACGENCFYLETDIDPVNRFRLGRYEAYVQDAWRVHPTVTLDLGLRYAFYRPLTDDDDMLFTFSPDAYDPAQAPTFADPAGESVIAGTGNLFNGIRVAGKDSPYGRAIYAADTNNLQPRLGAAWDPRGSGRTIVRAGYGMYFDQTQVGMFAQNVQSSLYDPFRTDRAVSNPSLSNPAAGSMITPFALFTPFVQATSERFVAPRWQHWNAGVQQRLYSHGVIDVGYVGSRGDHLLRYVDINKPQPADLVGHGDRVNTVRPFLGYSGITMRETTAMSRYHGVLTSFRHEAGPAGFAMVNYTYSRNKADATYDNSFLEDPQNALDKGAEYAAAQTDRTHIFTASYVYELPFARSAGGWRNALLGGWQIAGITRIESGPAARIHVFNCSSDNWCFPGILRPNQVGDPGAGDQSGLVWFNPAAFVPAPAGEYGSAPVAPFRLPGRHQWDFALSKSVHIGDTTRLQFRADLINAFNHTQFLDVDTDCASTPTCTPFPEVSFGQVISTRPPREVQLGVKLEW